MLGKVAAFASMFSIVFVAIVGIAFFMPLLIAFVAWDWNFNANWNLIYFFLRVNVIFSTLIAIAFVLSKEGKAFANEFNQMIKRK